MTGWFGWDRGMTFIDVGGLVFLGILFVTLIVTVIITLGNVKRVKEIPNLH